MLGYISPTRYTAIRTCPLRVAFDLAAKTGGTQRHNVAAIPGIAAHRTLEVLVATGGITEPNLPARVELEWQRAVSDVIGTKGSPRELARLVPAYFLYSARLVNAAAHVAELVAEADQVEPEVLWV